MKRFKIGLTLRKKYEDNKEYIHIARDYVTLIQDDFIPIFITTKIGIEETLELCDAVMILGGVDIDPNLYGEKNSGLSEDVNSELDEFDKIVIEHALKYQKPILGICRGIQSLAVFMGGTLHQDMKTANVSHPIIDTHTHMAKRIENFGLAKIMGDEIMVNTYHHQSINVVPNGFKVLYKNADAIEAIEHVTLPIIAFQWHPERLNGHKEEIIPYFKKMVQNSIK